MRVCLSLLAISMLAFPYATAATAAPRAPSGASASPPAKAAAARECRMRAVVHAWSARLNANDNAGVARLFALPSVVIQGSSAYRFHTRAQIALWHSALPCSGKIVSITIRGGVATAVFRLGNRAASRCDGPGTLAAARFEIVDGKIKLWAQVPVPEQKNDSGLIA